MKIKSSLKNNDNNEEFCNDNIPKESNLNSSEDDNNKNEISNEINKNEGCDYRLN